MMALCRTDSQRVRVLLVAVALCAAGVAQAQQPTVAGNTRQVHLRFAWPAMLQADVAYSGVSVEPDRPRPSTIGPFSARMIATTAGDEVRITYQGWTGGPGSDDAGLSLLQASEPIVAVLARGSGAVVRVEGRAAAEDAMKRASALKRYPDRIRQQITQSVPVAAEKDAYEVWFALVTAWAGNDLEVGADYATEGVMPIPASGERLRLDMRIRVDRVLDCPGTGRQRCVELRFRSVPNTEDAKRIIGAVQAEMAKLGVTRPPPTLSYLETVTEAVFVTEPDRLIPHRVEIKKTSRDVFGQENEQEHRERVTTATWMYRYPATSTAG